MPPRAPCALGPSDIQGNGGELDCPRLQSHCRAVDEPLASQRAGSLDGA